MSATVPAGGPTRLDAELREQVVAGLKRRRKFYDDAAAYVVINAILWVAWAVADRSLAGGVPWPAWVSVVWGLLLVLDGWRAFGRLRRPITEADVDAELERLRRR